MSYSLRGRLETRLCVSFVPLLVGGALAIGLLRWWPLELAAAMSGVGGALDLAVYHRLLRYQAGWVALPLGLLELALVMGAARVFHIGAPVWAALAFFAGAWLLAQVLVHAVLPLRHLSYAEDGGELGRAGRPLVAGVLGLLAFAGGFAWSGRPPTVHLAAGIHRGPIVLDHRQNFVGEDGAVVVGGLRIRASHVHVRNLEVVGGENGIDVDGAHDGIHDVVLSHVAVRGAELDGIHVRRASVAIRNCTIDSSGSRYGQGIDISFSYDLPMSEIRRCRIVGGQEGIVTHSTQAMVHDNLVSRTTLRGITMTEMSMGMVEDNDVRDALGVGIFCGDYSMCEIDGNRVDGTRRDRGDLARAGFGILAHYFAEAELGRNEVVKSPGGVAALAGAKLHHLDG